MGDLWNHLLMFETGSSVDTVLVNGEVVLRHGRCTRVDEEAILAAADEAARPGSDPAAWNEREAFQPLILDALKRDTPINRFADLY
jgi:hypothetical protein